MVQHHLQENTKGLSKKLLCTKNGAIEPFITLSEKIFALKMNGWGRIGFGMQMIMLADEV
jgi:hypothetical protein